MVACGPGRGWRGGGCFAPATPRGASASTVGQGARNSRNFSLAEKVGSGDWGHTCLPWLCLFSGLRRLEDGSRGADLRMWGG